MPPFIKLENNLPVVRSIDVYDGPDPEIIKKRNEYEQRRLRD